MNQGRTTLASLGIVLGLGALLVLLLYHVPRSTAAALTDRSGLLDRASVGFYGLALVTFLVQRFGNGRGDLRAGVLLLVLAALELDPGGWLGAHHPLRSGFLASPEVALLDKGLAVAAGLAVPGLLGSLVISRRREIIAGLRARRTSIVLVGLAVLFILVAEGLDRYEVGLNYEHGYRTWVGRKFAVRIGEEVLEFLVPVVLGMAVLFQTRDDGKGLDR